MPRPSRELPRWNRLGRLPRSEVAEHLARQNYGFTSFLRVSTMDRGRSIPETLTLSEYRTVVDPHFFWSVTGCVGRSSLAITYRAPCPALLACLPAYLPKLSYLPSQTCGLLLPWVCIFLLSPSNLTSPRLLLPVCLLDCPFGKLHQSICLGDLETFCDSCVLATADHTVRLLLRLLPSYDTFPS